MMGIFDLVFSAGALIHISLLDFPLALTEIDRVSGHCILAFEYFADEETIINYHGHIGMLRKRDFLKYYQTALPDLKLVRAGYWGPEHGFDRTPWWLLEKANGSENK